MKTRFSLHPVFTVLLSLALPVFAQTEGPPTAIDYQGRVLDAVGDPVAQGTTANIEMYFRIWDHISDAQGPNLIWAEKQIVTVADGNFSVRLGEGDQIQSSAGDNVIVPAVDDKRGALLEAFNGKDRFLGVSVAPNSVTKPLAEIQPRLAFLTSPFSAVAEKARFAEFGPTNGTFSADKIGVGVSAPGSLLEVDGPNALSPTNGGGLISSGSIGGSHIAFDADDIQGYSDGATPSALNLNAHGGATNIGSIGELTRVSGLFQTSGAQGGSFKVFDNLPVGGEQIVAGVQGFFAGGQIQFEGAGTPINIGQDASGNFVVERNGGHRLMVTASGNVGIGTTNPLDRLSIGGSSNNLRIGGGDIKLLAQGGAPFFTNYNPSVEWVDAAGTRKSIMWRWNSFNRLYITNSTSSTDGVYLTEHGNTWINASDERLKSNIEPITGILEKIEKIRVVDFNKANVDFDEASGKVSVEHNRPARKTRAGKVIKHEIGSIAQDWLEHFPELVAEPETDEAHYGLAYSRIGVIAIGAAQELNTKLQVQERQIAERDRKIAELEARLAKIEALMSAAK